MINKLTKQKIRLRYDEKCVAVKALPRLFTALENLHEIEKKNLPF